MNILGIGYEPWETEVVASTNSKLKKRGKNVKIGIFIADLWQFHWRHANKNLERIIESHPQDVFSLKEEFYMWQPTNRKNIDYEKEILIWSKTHNIRVSTRILLSTDHFFGGFERSPAYRKLTENDKSAILYHYLMKITETVEKFRPDFVWCIESNYLAKNIFAALCDAKNITMYTLAHTRVEDYWVIRSSMVFPFGLIRDAEASQQAIIKETASVGESDNLDRSQAEVFIGMLATKFSTEGVPLYSGATEVQNKEYRGASQARIRALLVELYKTLKQVVYIVALRIRFYQRMSRRWVYLEDWDKLTIHTMSSFFRKMIYIFIGLPFAHRKVPCQPYFYLPLHYRPEASSLTLNRGLTDELMISLAAALLPHGTLLAVKEHPMMVDCRRRSFYKVLNELSGVYLVDPSVPTVELVTQSIGILSGSGTALLEASLVGKPAHAFGKPEFIDYLDSSGLDSLEDFLVSCAHSRTRASEDRMKIYLSQVLANGRKLKLGWSTLECESNFERTTDLVCQMLIDNFDQKSLSRNVSRPDRRPYIRPAV